MNDTKRESLTQEHLQGILSNMQEGLIVLNKSDVVEKVNDAAVKIFGFTNGKALVDRHIRDFFADPEDATDFLLLLSHTDHLADRESGFTKGDGQPLTGCYSATLIRDSTGTVSLKAIFIHDITESKKIEQRLDEYMRKLEGKNKELDQFAHIVSHDLKAPLRAISNLSTWIQEDLGPNLGDDTKKNLEMMRSRVSRMEALISGVLEYSKIGRLQAPSESIDVFILLTETLELLAPAPNIKIEIGENMPTVTAPRVMLSQVFSNLIGNAIKYNDKAEGHISVIQTENENHHQFTIGDNGPGIAPEYFETIFQIFQTLQSRDKFESTGVGLTIVKRIIEELGGSIWVESEIGTGTRFIFKLPKKRDTDGVTKPEMKQ